VIEACGLLADGEPAVLLVAADCPLPDVFAPFADRDEQPHAFAWLMAASGAQGERLALEWAATDAHEEPGGLPGTLEVLRFHAAGAPALERVADRRRWRWSRGD
jgi:hypothetical protein